MKSSSFFGFAFLLFAFSLQPLLHLRAPASAPRPVVWNEQRLAGKPVFYFIEAQCSACNLTEGGTAGKYLVVTPGISTADYDNHPELLEKFRLLLATRFPGAPALRDGLTFSFHFTTGEAEAMRQTELEQKQAAGYEIVELELTQ